MKTISLQGKWLIQAPIEKVFNIVTDFEKFPIYFPKVAESIDITKRDGNYLEIDAMVRSFGKNFPVKMKTTILPSKGFISDNNSYVFGTSGHEELILSQQENGTLVNYTYNVTIHKRWLRIVATPLIHWYSMKFWKKAVIDRLRAILEK